MFSSNATQVSSAANYIEDVFSTYLYTGNGSSQTITNGIDLATYGGMLWLKARSAISYNLVTDSARGAGAALRTESTAANQNIAGRSFYTNGFDVNGSSDNFGNGTNTTYASWTFRKQPKFFDVVTYTGNGVSGRSISHNLGSVPGCIIIKSTTRVSDWVVYHQSVGSTKTLILNSTVASADYGNNISSVTSTSFNVTGGSDSNANGDSYVAYIYAHNAGGFGLTGTDNVISCGSFTSSSIGLATVDLGYEPQWILYKGSNGVTNWQMVDNMRGFVVGAANAGTSYLNANTSAAEATTPPVGITNTGFNFDGAANITYIYIAIRRGPMKVPTSGTSVFEPVTYTGTGADITVSSSNVVDLAITMARTSGGFSAWDKLASTRLTGNTFLSTNLTDAEASGGNVKVWNATQNSITLNQSYASFATNFTYVTELFKRAPSFFDVVCYTGTGSARTVTHNLGAVPEMMVVKNRSVTGAWNVYTATTGNTSFLEWNTAYQQTTNSGTWNNTSPTSSVFTVGTTSATNGSGNNLVAYLFATCAGVSKVGSYSGTGATQTISCGFTGGARFVLIKRINVDGYDWYVWDTARGMVSGTDPSLLLNSTAAEVNANSIYTTTGGFQIVSTAAGINASGGTYIFLAIA